MINTMRVMMRARAVFKTLKEARNMDGTKPGVRTTEFWGKIAAQTIALVSAASGAIDPELAAIIIGSLEAIYALARAIVKMKGGDLPELPAKKS